MVDRTVLNAMVGNGDAHGKNIGILYGADRSLRLTPAYDILSSEAHGFDTDLAISVGGSFSSTGFTNERWASFLRECELDTAAMRRHIPETVRRVLVGVESAREQVKAWNADHPVLDEVVAAIKRRSAEMGVEGAPSG